MAKVTVKGTGTAGDPWILKTPPGTSAYKMHRDETSDPPALVCVVGSTKLSYRLRCIEDLNAMLKKGLGGRFAMYVPPLMEALGKAEVEHNAKGNRMRAL